MRHLLETGAVGQILDVVTTVMQIVTAAPDRTQRGVAGGGAAEGDGLLRFGQGVGSGIGHDGSWVFHAPWRGHRMRRRRRDHDFFVNTASSRRSYSWSPIHSYTPARVCLVLTPAHLPPPP